MNDPRKTITLVLMLPNDKPRDDGFCLLRKLLKSLVRGYGLKCVDIRETTTNEKDEPSC
jgi:hypothetical protein